MSNIPSLTLFNSSTAILLTPLKNSKAICSNSSKANKVQGMNKRRELTDEQKADAARLKAIFQARQKETREQGGKLTQADLGEMCGWDSGQSAASQYLNGYVPLNIDALLRLSKVLNFDPSEVSPSLVSDIKSVRPVSANVGSTVGSPTIGYNHVDTGLFADAKNEIISELGEPVLLKHGLTPVKGKAMLGANGYFDEMDYPPGAGDGYLKFYSDDPNAYALRVVGSSMEPRIRSGEFVVLEPEQTYVAGDEVLIRTQDGLAMIKVFMYHRDGEVRLLSINDSHPPLTIPESSITVIHPVGAIVKPSRLVEL